MKKEIKFYYKFIEKSQLNQQCREIANFQQKISLKIDINSLYFQLVITLTVHINNAYEKFYNSIIVKHQLHNSELIIG